MTSTLLLFIGGLLLLILGAEILVRGASRLAAVFGVSPLAIGLTIVAIGTASPEIAVSLQAAVNGQGDLTLGNVLGSNIFNILFILGLTALLAPIVIAEQLIRLDAPIMLGVSLLAFGLALDGSLGRLDGTLLAAGLIGYIIFALRQSRSESKQVQSEYAQEFAAKEPRTARNTTINILFILAGLGLLVLGSRWLVNSAVILARLMGVSELVIGLTVVAVGTSLPEVATSIIAALKKESDIAVGNAVGSNILNLLGVLGLGALLAPRGISVPGHVLRIDFLAMVFTALVSLPVFYIDNRISRGEGLLLLGCYVFYMAYILMQAVGSPVLPAVTWIGILLAPATLMGLAIVAFRHRRSAGVKFSRNRDK
jgi:cation:H+ antiporter